MFQFFSCFRTSNPGSDKPSEIKMFIRSRYLGICFLKGLQRTSKIHRMSRFLENKLQAAQHSEKIEMIHKSHVADAENLSFHVSLAAGKMNSETFFQSGCDPLRLVVLHGG